MARTVTVSGRPLLLDEILAKAFGPETGRALVTATLELNPGLSALGRQIPVGTAIMLPEKPADPPAISFVSLFG